MSLSDGAGQSSFVILEQRQKCSFVFLPVVCARIDNTPPLGTCSERSLHFRFFVAQTRWLADTKDKKKKKRTKSSFYRSFVYYRDFVLKGLLIFSISLLNGLKETILFFSPVLLSPILSFSFMFWARHKIHIHSFSILVLSPVLWFTLVPPLSDFNLRSFTSSPLSFEKSRDFGHGAI